VRNLISAVGGLRLSSAALLLALSACTNYHTRDVSIPQGYDAAIGGRPGSILPPGRNWTLVWADEFNNGYDHNIWSTPPVGPDPVSVCWWDDSQSLAFVNGTVEMRSADASPTTGNLPVCGRLTSTQQYPPGYFEARLRPGSGWDAFWVINMGPDCSPITSGFEADILEIMPDVSPAASGWNNMIWSGYGNCNQQNQNSPLNLDSNQWYTFGFDYSSERGATYYLNGQPTWTHQDVAGVPFPVQIIISGGSYTRGGKVIDGNNPPFAVDWVRYYQDEGPSRRVVGGSPR